MTRKKQPSAKPPLAYTVPELGDAIGRSAAWVQQRIDDGKLVASYDESPQGLILVAEAQRWLDSLPTEKPIRRAS